MEEKRPPGSVERGRGVGVPTRGPAIARRPAVGERFGRRARRDVIANGGAVMRRVIVGTWAWSAVVAGRGSSGWVMGRGRLGREIHRARAAEVGIVRKAAWVAAAAGGGAGARSTGACVRIGHLPGIRCLGQGARGGRARARTRMLRPRAGGT